MEQLPPAVLGYIFWWMGDMAAVYRSCACKHWLSVARAQVTVGGNLRVTLHISANNSAARIRSFLKVPWLNACRALKLMFDSIDNATCAAGLVARLGDALLEVSMKKTSFLLPIDGLHLVLSDALVHSLALNCTNLVSLRLSYLISTNVLKHLLLCAPSLRSLTMPMHKHARGNYLGMVLCLHGTALEHLKIPLFYLTGLRPDIDFGLPAVRELCLDCKYTEMANVVGVLQACRLSPLQLKRLVLKNAETHGDDIRKLVEAFPGTRIDLRDCLMDNQHLRLCISVEGAEKFFK